MTDLSLATQEAGGTIHATWIRWLSCICLAMVLFFSTHSFQFLFVNDVAGGLAERPSARSSPAYLATFAVQSTLFALLLGLHLMRNGISRPLLLAAGYCFFVAGSVFWSTSPGTTMVPAILFSYLVVAAYVSSTLFGPRAFLQAYFYVGFVILVSSFMLLGIGSEYAGSSRYGGGWFLDLEFSGVMASKNFAGVVFASLAVLSINAHWIGIPFWMRAVVFLLGVIAIALSNSATAIMIFLFLAPLSILVRFSGSSWQALVFLSVAGLALLLPALPFISAGDFLSVIGRDPTFTGRSQLWDTAFSEFLDYPLFGRGYYAFFDTNPYSSVWRMWEQSRYWNADNFHNSSVDVLVSLGLVGVSIMIGTIIWAATVVANPTIDPGSRALLALQLGVFAIGSMMEFAFFHHNYVATFVLFYALFAGFWRYDDDEKDMPYAV